MCSMVGNKSSGLENLSKMPSRRIDLYKVQSNVSHVRTRSIDEEIVMQGFDESSIHIY